MQNPTDEHQETLRQRSDVPPADPAQTRPIPSQRDVGVVEPTTTPTTARHAAAAEPVIAPTVAPTNVGDNRQGVSKWLIGAVFVLLIILVFLFIFFVW